MSKGWSVYMHENRANGKRYIGITGRKPETRWANGAGYVGNTHFYQAITKYGWDAFRHEILYSNLTKEDAAQIETDLIVKYQTLDPDKGYNLAPGGFAPEASASTRRKMSETQHSLWSDPEHRRRMCESFKGHPVSEETKEKIRQSNMGHKVSDEARRRMRANHYDVTGARNPRARAVICVDTGVTYPTAKEAAQLCGTHKSDIAKCCKGKLKTAGGLHWQYHDEESQSLNDSDSIHKLQERRRKRHG